MKLRTKLLLPVLASGLAVIAYVYGYWAPRTLASRETAQLEASARQLSSIAIGLAPLMLDNKVDTIHENLSDLLKENAAYWRAVRLTNREGKLLFPLATDRIRPFGDGADVRVLRRTVQYLDDDLGQLQVSLDLSPIRTAVRAEQAGLVGTMLVLFVLVTLMVMLTLEFAVRKPIGRLSDAAQRLAQDRDDTPLPAAGRDEIGALVASFASMRDDILRHETAMRAEIDERTRAQEALTLARDAAEAANRAKSDFVANMSHEIRTPMNGVLGMLSLLLETRLDREQSEFAETARISAESLLGILNDILDLSKIEAGRLVLEAVDFDLHVVVAEVGRLFALRCGEKGIGIRSVIEPDVPPTVRGDPIRLRQILVNLVGNAVKFTERGRIDLRLKRIDAPAGAVGLRFEVADNGIGIPAAQMPELFKPFMQADSSTTRRFGGTGLGLSIAKRLTELLGGDIGVESVEGAGSTFWFTCRFAPASGAARVATESRAGAISAAPVRDGASILVVEDNAINQAVVVGLLEKMGHRATVARNGVEALQRLTHTRYDMVLMDCQMPEMDGYETTRAIRSGASGVLDAGVPIIALTASAMDGDRERVLDAGMNAYLAKPVTRDALSRAIDEWRTPQRSAGG